MKTILLTLIASTIGILSLAADQLPPEFPVIGNGTLIHGEFLPTLPPGWQIIALQRDPGSLNGHPLERMFILNPTTGQVKHWLIELGF